LLIGLMTSWVKWYLGEATILELMRDGDPRNLCAAGKMATVVQDSIGQTPWLMDILWHLPSSEVMHRVRKSAASMMRNRVNAVNVKIRDLSSYLIEGDVRTGEKISLWDLEIEAVIAMSAGSDNTSSSITLAMYFLLTQPEIYKKLQMELDTVFQHDTISFDNTKLTSILLLNAVVNESLRLGTPFYIPRIVPKQGTTIDGKAIPGDCVVALSAYSQQISAENFYPDPLEFRPQRWLPEGLGPETILKKQAIWSFSTGAYICVAKNFALQEMRYVISRIVLSFDMTFAPGFNAQAWLKGFRNMRTTFFDKPLLVKSVRRST